MRFTREFVNPARFWGGERWQSLVSHDPSVPPYGLAYDAATNHWGELPVSPRRGPPSSSPPAGDEPHTRPKPPSLTPSARAPNVAP